LGDSAIAVESKAVASTFTTASTRSESIESIRLGSRVPDQNPISSDYDFSFGAVDAATWKQIDVRLRRSDGALVEMQLLRPMQWVEELELTVGGTLAMQLLEMEVDGLAEVTSIADCPEISDGRGSVVTGRFVTHQVSNLIEVTLATGTRFTGTTTHPVWLPDHQLWVPIVSLLEGDRVDTLDGPVAIASLTRLATIANVYNLEVHGHHVYRVTNDGVLVHNTCPVAPIRTAKAVHDSYLNKVRPGARERVFETPWSSGKGLGSRKFDDFDFMTGTGFEANTTPWSTMTQEQLSRKLDQVGSDFALLKTNPDVKRIVWFGTEPLPTTGLGGQLREALQKAGIPYWVVNP